MGDNKDLFKKASDIISKLTGKDEFCENAVGKYAIPEFDKKNYGIIKNEKDDLDVEKYAIPNEPDDPV